MAAGGEAAAPGPAAPHHVPCQWAYGTVFQPDYVSQRLTKILKKNDLPYIRFHDLRHTAESMLVNGGHMI